MGPLASRSGSKGRSGPSWLCLLAHAPLFAVAAQGSCFSVATLIPFRDSPLMESRRWNSSQPSFAHILRLPVLIVSVVDVSLHSGSGGLDWRLSESGLVGKIAALGL